MRRILSIIACLSCITHASDGLAKPEAFAVYCSLTSNGDLRCRIWLPAKTSNFRKWHCYVGGELAAVASGNLLEKPQWVDCFHPKGQPGSAVICTLLDSGDTVMAVAESSAPVSPTDPREVLRTQLGTGVLGAIVALLSLFLGGWLSTGRERKRERRALAAALDLWLRRELRHLDAVERKEATLDTAGALQVPAWLSGQSFPLHASVLQDLSAAALTERAELVFQGLRMGETLSEAKRELGALLREVEKRR